MFSHFLSFYKLEKNQVFKNNVKYLIFGCKFGFWGPFMMEKIPMQYIGYVLDSSFEMWFWYQLRLRY